MQKVQRDDRKAILIPFYKNVTSVKSAIVPIVFATFADLSKGPFKYYFSKEVGGYEEMLTSCLRWVKEMLTSADKVGGSKKGQNMLT